MCIRESEVIASPLLALEFLITGSKLPILRPRQIWSIYQKMREMTISKATFAPSTPCIIYFECLQSGPNDSTRVRPLTGILRHARVKIFILVMGAFGPTFRIFEQFDWAPRNQNCKIDMELQIKIYKLLCQT